MNIQTLTMDPRQADAAWREYREILKGEHTKADAWLCRAYRAMRRSLRIMNISDAFRATGVDEKGRPKMAFMRADKEACTLDTSWRNGDFTLTATRTGSWKGKPVEFAIRSQWLGIDRATLPANRRNISQLPAIPPRFRPPQDKLANYWLLWEAAWESIPVDPFLLKPLGGPFYVVVAQWDLSAAEQAVMAYLQNR